MIDRNFILGSIGKKSSRYRHVEFFQFAYFSFQFLEIINELMFILVAQKFIVRPLSLISHQAMQTVELLYSVRAHMLEYIHISE